MSAERPPLSHNPGSPPHSTSVCHRWAQHIPHHVYSLAFPHSGNSGCVLRSEEDWSRPRASADACGFWSSSQQVSGPPAPSPFPGCPNMSTAQSLAPGWPTGFQGKPRGHRQAEGLMNTQRKNGTRGSFLAMLYVSASYIHYHL